MKLGRVQVLVTLDEAYALLGLDDPTLWQRSTRIDAPSDRCTGATTHTVIELYLDMDLAFQAAAKRGTNPAPFLFVVPTMAMGIHLRGVLHDMHHTLRLSVDLERLQLLIPDHRSLERQRGNTWYSWAIFCDHTVKAEVITSPFNRIRSLHEEEDESWTAKDRDGAVVMQLTESGKTQFLKNTTCPVSVVPSWLDFPACYPAWTHEQLKVRLVESFKI